MPRRLLTSLLLILMPAGCGEEGEVDPCVAKAGCETLMDLGRASAAVPFQPVEDEYIYEMGPQGMAMFEHIAPRVHGLVAPPAGRLRDEVGLQVLIDGEAIGDEERIKISRAGPGDTFEVVGLRVVLHPREYPTLWMWGRTVRFDAWVEDCCGRRAEQGWDLLAIEPDW